MGLLLNAFDNVDMFYEHNISDTAIKQILLKRLSITV